MMQNAKVLFYVSLKIRKIDFDLKLFQIIFRFCLYFQVLDVVHAVETLAKGPQENVAPPKSPGGPNSELKTTTIVMSKHTLAAQPTTVSTNI